MRAAPALVLFAFALSLLVVVATPWCTRDRVTAPLRWVEAVRDSSMLAPGDILLVHPPWRDDVVRALRANGAIPSRTVTTALAPRHGEPLPAVVVVSDGSAPLPRALRERIDTTEEHGALVLSRLLARAPTSKGGARSLLDDLAQARVELRPLSGSAPVIPCPWDPLRDRHSCAGMPEWLHVGIEELPVGGESVRCAWAHPKTDKLLAIHLPRARLLDSLELSLGLTDGSALNAAAAPVTALVRIGGVESAQLIRQPGTRGFAVQRISIAGAPRDADVDIEITTPDDGQRHACILLQTSPAAAP